MVRSFAAEERLLTSRHETLQRSKPFETGILIAQVGPKVDTLLRFVPTPEQEGSPAGTLDANWILEHAMQVSRMVPGGVAVLGCYAFAATAKLSSIETKLQPVLSKLAKQLPASASERQAVLLSLPSDAKKVACRALPIGATRLQPIEIKALPSAPQVGAAARPNPSTASACYSSRGRRSLFPTPCSWH